MKIYRFKEYLSENKYIDGVLDRMNAKCSDKDCDNNIYKLDNEYLRKLKSGEDVSSIEKQYDEYEELHDEIFKERSLDIKNLDFILINDSPLFYNKDTKEVKKYSETIFFDEHPSLKLYLEDDKLEKEPMDLMIYDIIFDIYESDGDLDILERKINYRFREYNINKNRINGSRWLVLHDGNKLVIGTGYIKDKNYNYSFLGVEYLTVEKYK